MAGLKEDDVGGPYNPQGLTKAEADERRLKYGKNEVEEDWMPSWQLFLMQFYGKMPGMIILAIILTGVTQQWDDFSICTGMLLINGILGFTEANHAREKARELREKSKVKSEVIVNRGKQGQEKVDIIDLVPGDVIEYPSRPGQKAPADCEWIKQTSGDMMRMDEMALTGETEPIKVGAPPAKKKLLLAAATCIEGECICVVRKTGANTMAGQAQACMEEKSESEFEIAIQQMVGYVIMFSVSVAVVILFVQLIFRGEWDRPAKGNRPSGLAQTLLDCISLLIGSVPVALPMVLTVTLSFACSYMTKHGANVAKSKVLQDLAVMQHLCSDKTGTLTTGHMTLSRSASWVSGEHGRVAEGFRARHPITGSFLTKEDLSMFAMLAVDLKKRNHIDDAIAQDWHEKPGDPTSACMARQGWRTIGMCGFVTSQKRTSCVVEHIDTGTWVQIGKGATTVILDTGDDGQQEEHHHGGKAIWKCKGCDEMHPDKVEQGAVTLAEDSLAKSSYKSVAVCIQNLGNKGKKPDANMYFAGILAVRDPPRDDTKEVVAKIKKLGVGVKMVTGDALSVAQSVSGEIDLGKDLLVFPDAARGVKGAAILQLADRQWRAGSGVVFKAAMKDNQTEAVPEGTVVESQGLTKGAWEKVDWGGKVGWISGTLIDVDPQWQKKADERDDKIVRADGFAQVKPTDKVTAVVAHKNKGFTVGMTGDGVNDAAALNRANAGIAVADATEAAIAAADMNLTQGGLSAIVEAIEESRRVFQRLQTYVIFRVAHTVHVVFTIASLTLVVNFVLDPLYVIIMALFNDIAIMTIGTDNAIPSQCPSTPRVGSMFALAVAIGVVQSASTMCLFTFGHHFLLEQATQPVLNPDGTQTDVSLLSGQNPKHDQDWESIQDGERHDYMQTCLYLQMATTAGLLIFQTRVKHFIFARDFGTNHYNVPSTMLLVAMVLVFVVSTLLSTSTILGQPISWDDVGDIWVYNVIVFFIIEVVKISMSAVLPSDKWQAPPEYAELHKRQTKVHKEVRAHQAQNYGAI